MSEERNNDMDIRDVLQTNDTAIEAVDLVKDYGRGENVVHALRDVNVRFERGRGRPAPANPR